MTRKKKNFIFKSIVLHLFFVVLVFVTLIPIIYALSISFSGDDQLISSNFRLFSSNFTLSNYRALFVEQPLLTWFKNTLILSVFTLLIALLVGVMAAYAFSRRTFKGKRKLFNGLILLNAFPAILSMFALWRLMSSGPIPLTNTKLGLILIYAGTMSIFSVINLKGYFDTIPVQIEEAARLDGCNEAQVIWHILLPLARPALIVTAVMILIFVWNEYIFSVTFMTGESQYTLAAGLYSLQAGEMSGSWPIFAAASLVVSFPVLIVFLRVQKYMTSGLTVGGVK